MDIHWSNIWSFNGVCVFPAFADGYAIAYSFQ